MPINRSHFIKSLALGTVFHLLDSNAHLELLAKKRAMNEWKIQQSNKNNLALKPKALKQGDTLGLVSPASPVYNPDEFEEMLAKVKPLGYNVVLGEHARDRRGYLAGTDQDRAKDLMNMFLNPSIDGILCVRGGWGCNRMLPYLDYEAIAANPKILCGFSDITSLHLAIWEKSKLHTFHGPVGTSSWSTYSTRYFKEVIEKGGRPSYQYPENYEDDHYTIVPGRSEGILLGGNLTVLCSLIGSEYIPDFSDSILYLEDVGEDVYRVDRMLTQLKLSGLLDKINGFVFGKCTNCDAGSNSLSLTQVFSDHIGPLGIPSFYGALISHETDNSTIPVGIKASMDAELGKIEILESAVTLS
ncbi:MAG: LD-carboxypeptidase [Balneola sp.]|nr:LD-carboxypeptidase [Balneola sp.]